MRIAIKSSAPVGPDLTKWGDYHFALSLQKALEARGASVVQHFWPQWDRDDGEDVVLVLRGKRRFIPPANKVSLLWIISHPATVSPAEIDAFTVASVASETHRDLLAGATRTPVQVLRQCTDTTLFVPPADPVAAMAQRRDIIFVANSRGIRRNIVQWAIDAGVKPAIVGRHWGGVGLSGLVKQEYVDNDRLPDFYRASRLSLNDHWGDMLHYGTINNRIFDCLACGLPVLTDDFRELRAVCGDGLLYASDAASYWQAIGTYTLRYPEVVERTQRLWERLRPDYSFAVRAEQLLHQARHPPARDDGPRPRPAGPDTALAGATAALPELIGPLVARQRERQVRNEIQLFHVCPTLPGSQSLAGSDRFNYLSGGLGIGPWHIALQKDLSQLPPDRFDLVLLEDTALLDPLPLAHQAMFARALLAKAKASASFALPALRGNLVWMQRFEELGLKRVGESHGWVLFEPPTP